jgi:hypothetical protein
LKMIYYKDKTIQLQCTNPDGSTLARVRFKHGDRIAVTLWRNWNGREGQDNGGSWGNGLTHYLVKDIANRIINMQTGEVIWQIAIPGVQESI